MYWFWLRKNTVQKNTVTEKHMNCQIEKIAIFSNLCIIKMYNRDNGDNLLFISIVLV